ncbi:MAG: hypothetical protein K8R48_06950 [Alphaproteobacteria bacterium]|nr:hypothetical protein [Alphaproteobacteria bacterium]
MLLLSLNLAFWGISREVYSKWEGVPPVPSRRGAVTMSLGDAEFSYRFLAITLQNLGDVGRDVTPLKNYDYEKLGKWFFLLHALDPASNHVPLIAAYYFGGTRVPKDVAVVVSYLSTVGQIPAGEKWRWLAHAAYLAQHRMNNPDLALKFAYKLVRMNRDEGVEMPQWARQMPAFILKNRGDKQAAKELMENMLVSDRATAPEEINFMKSFLIDQLGVDPEEVEGLVRLRAEGHGDGYLAN